MPRKSLRSLWTVARSGLLFSLFLCAGSFSSSLFAQMDYAAMDAEKMAGPMTGAQQGAGLYNRGSGIKRSENSLGRIQALLYADAVCVAHVNFNKVDYEGIAAFVDEVVDVAGGAVQSNDQYQVDLREYQKSQAKSSFKKLASTVQNIIVQNAFSNKIDEFYFISYKNGKDPGCDIYALPLDGLSVSDQNKAIDAVTDKFKPIAVFTRFGFIVAVVDHESATKVDMEAINAKYMAKLEDSQKAVYGSYTASGSANNNMYGMRSGMAGSADMMGASRQDGNAQSALMVEYQKEIAAAEKDARVTSRQKALPFVRKRFSKPATAEESKTLADALRVGDGNVLTVAVNNLNNLESLVNKGNKGADAEVAQPFAGLGSDNENADAQETLASNVMDELKNVDSSKSAKSLTVALSLMGSPKLVAFFSFNTPDDAKNFSDAYVGSLALIQPMVKLELDKQMVKVDPDTPVDFTPFLNDLFTAVRPTSKDANVAIVLDLDVVKNNASVFLPLLGGKEAKTQQELESESIDWSAADDKDEADEAAQTPDDDPFADAADVSADEDDADDAADQSAGSDDEDDDPFGGDDDPF